MHAISHSLAHRAPPAPRTRVRWQPYSSVPSSSIPTALPSPVSTQLNTPDTSVTSSPANSSSCEASRPRPATLNLIKDPSSRDLSKSKVALGLIDQAVRSLGDIWKSEDIPTVFLTGPKATLTSKPLAYPLNLQISSHLSPYARLSSEPLPLTQKEVPPHKNGLLPIKGFVHQVLRRSRTSCHVLQTALCYIEALRTKVPALIRKEKAGEPGWREPELADVFEVAADSQLQQHAEVEMSLDTLINTDQCDTFNPSASTVRIIDEHDNTSPMPDGQLGPDVALLKPRKSEMLPLTVELPSPLLCPRRSFLAALILASKFTQDKCYSNRAWAKLSGLSPREIGRCERALGAALEWRLWVGKPAVAQTSPSTLPVSTTPRPLHRVQSEGCIKLMPSEPFLMERELPTLTSDRTIRRCATLPADPFAVAEKSEPSSNSTLPALHSLVHAPQWPIASARHDATDESPDSQSSTPPLVYSPTASESSSGGDRTIQATSFQESMEDSQTLADHLSTTSPFASKPPAILPSIYSTASGLGAIQRADLVAPSVILAATIGQIEGVPCLWRLEETAFVS